MLLRAAKHDRGGFARPDARTGRGSGASHDRDLALDASSTLHRLRDHHAETHGPLALGHVDGPPTWRLRGLYVARSRPRAASSYFNTLLTR